MVMIAIRTKESIWILLYRASVKAEHTFENDWDPGILTYKRCSQTGWHPAEQAALQMKALTAGPASNLLRQELTVSALAQRVSGCSLMFCMLRSLYMALCCITLCQALCTILRILTGPVPSHALHRKTDLKTSQTSLHASSRAWTWMKHIEALYHVMICWYILWWVMHGMTSMAGSKIKKTAEACEILWN